MKGLFAALLRVKTLNDNPYIINVCIRELILRVFDAKVELLLSIFRGLSSASCRLCRVIPYVDEDVKWTAL